MQRVETGEYSQPPMESHYKFFNPETLVDQEMKEWLARSTVAHIAPLWLPLSRDGRRYGGAEDVAINNITTLNNFQVKRQVIFGHPANSVLEEKIPDTKVFQAGNIDAGVDLLSLLRTEPSTAQSLERLYVREAYGQIAAMHDTVTIIHDHTNYGRDQALWVSQFVKPVIKTEHGPLTQPAVSEIEEANLRMFEKHRSIGFVSISQHQQQQMPNLNWLGTAYNGVNLEDFVYQENKSDYLVFLGRICRDKGTHNAVQAARELGMKLIIAGAVEETPLSLQYFAEEIEPYIDNTHILHLANGVNAGERKALLSNAQALLMLIEWDEPFGMVMAEALASGTPVVGYRKGSVPEIVQGNTGFVVDSFSEAVTAIKQVRKGNYSSQDCRERTERFFSKEAMTAKYIQFYMQAERAFYKH